MNRNLIILASLVSALALGIGWWWSSREHQHQLVQKTDAQGETYWTCVMHPQVRQSEPGNCPICGMTLVERRAEQKATATTADGERKLLYWYDPMKPEVHFDAPGKSPFMDMDLVPKYADDSAAGETISIPSQMVQNLGIRTAKVERGTFWQRVDTVGTVEVDAHRIRTIESRAPGWIEDQRIHAVGERVNAGDMLAGIYAPDLYAAQEELLLARRSGDVELAAAARQRLVLLGATGAQIDTVVRSGRAMRALPLLSPSDGIVLDIEAHEGRQIAPGMPLARIADLSRVWMIAEVPEAQAAWVGVDRHAEARLAALSGRVFEGTVDYVYPSVETGTRTLRVRLIFDNPDWVLKPGMYADVTLFGGPLPDVLTIPSEALIRTGTRSVVIVADDSEHFRPVAVQAGPERNDRTVILSGLEEGEQVVVSGQFLIDSEASLRGAFNRMGSAVAGQSPHPGPPPQAGEGTGHYGEHSDSLPRETGAGQGGDGR